MNLWKLIDKWGPGAIALITLLGVVAYGWINGERVSRLEGRIDYLNNQLASQHADAIESQEKMNQIKSWMIAVYERGQAKGWELPSIPTLDTVGVGVDVSDGSKEQ